MRPTHRILSPSHYERDANGLCALAIALIRYETGKPEVPEKVHIVTEYLADDYTILAFKLLSLKAGYTYELTWYYR